MTIACIETTICFKNQSVRASWAPMDKNEEQTRTRKTTTTKRCATEKKDKVKWQTKVRIEQEQLRKTDWTKKEKSFRVEAEIEIKRDTEGETDIGKILSGYLWSENEEQSL